MTQIKYTQVFVAISIFMNKNYVSLVGAFGKTIGRSPNNLRRISTSDTPSSKGKKLQYNQQQFRFYHTSVLRIGDILMTMMMMMMMIMMSMIVITMVTSVTRRSFIPNTGTIALTSTWATRKRRNKNRLTPCSCING